MFNLKNLAVGFGAALALYGLGRYLTRSTFSFRDRVVIITGGSRGLGLELARIFAAEGAKMAICARTGEACRRGDPVETVSCASALAARMNGIFPGLLTRCISLIDAYLPDSGNGSRQIKKGWQSESAWSPSWLTQLDDQAAVRNNEF